MLLHHNGRFEHGSCAFRLPNRFYLNTDPDSVDENKVEMISADENVFFTLVFEPALKSAYEHLTEVFADFEEETLTVLQPVHAIEAGGFHGYHTRYVVSYESSRNGRVTKLYDESVLEVPGDEPELLTFYFRGDGKDWNERLLEKAYADVLDNIEKIIK